MWQLQVLASGTYNGLAHDKINGTYTSISNITLDSYDIESLVENATATGDVGGYITATQNVINILFITNLSIQTMTLLIQILNMH